MKSWIRVTAALAVTVLAGCDKGPDQKPVDEQRQPFAVGGVWLGAPMSKVMERFPGMTCKPASPTLSASCEGWVREANLFVFGKKGEYVLAAEGANGSVGSIIVNLEPDRYTWKEDIESYWGLNGRCVNLVDLGATPEEREIRDLLLKEGILDATHYEITCIGADGSTVMVDEEENPARQMLTISTALKDRLPVFNQALADLERLQKAAERTAPIQDGAR